MKNLSQAQKKEYSDNLRSRWELAKKAVTEEKKLMVKAIKELHGLDISIINFTFIKDQMESRKMDGMPYIDAMTYRKWREQGFQVKKGEHSQLQAITWIGKKKEADGLDKDEKKSNFIYPKQYNLFHRTQVEAI